MSHSAPAHAHAHTNITIFHFICQYNRVLIKMTDRSEREAKKQERWGWRRGREWRGIFHPNGMSFSVRRLLQLMLFNRSIAYYFDPSTPWSFDPCVRHSESFVRGSPITQIKTDSLILIMSYISSAFIIIFTSLSLSFSFFYFLSVCLSVSLSLSVSVSLFFYLSVFVLLL